FIDTYTENNHKLWREYHLGIISKETLRSTRFKKTFTELGLPEHVVPASFEDDYVRICPTKTNLFPHTIEVLEYLKERYHLHIITNGFKESSDLKIKLSGLGSYFKHIFISESIGIYKPDAALFKHAIHFSKTTEEK